jgi:hypothetical protein
MAIFCGECGPALIVGNDSDRRCVVRPVSDLISCSNCILLRNSDAQIRKMLVGVVGGKFPDLECTWFQKHSHIWPLDITVTPDSALCIVVGFRGDAVAMAFDGTKLVELPGSVKPLFRFVGYDRGIKLGQHVLYSVCAAGFVNGNITNFCNEICGVYGIHVIRSPAESLSNHPGCYASPLPPYVNRMLRSIADDKGPTLTKITVPHVPMEDIFYDCEIPPDTPTIADLKSAPRLLTTLGSDGFDGPRAAKK